MRRDRGPDLIFPGLEEDDPLKRETQRLAGASYAEGFEAVMRQGIVPTTQYATVDTDLGADGAFAWDGPYEFDESGPPHNMGGDKAASIRVDDGFTNYIAGTATIGSKFSTTPIVDRTGLKYFVDYRACILFGTAAGRTMQFRFRPVGTAVYTTGSFSVAFLNRNSFTRQLSPQLTFSGTEAFRSTAQLSIFGGAGPLYLAVTFARVVAKT